jgi:hypothetical protein
MNCARFNDADAFDRSAGPFLREHAIENNIILGLIRRLCGDAEAAALMLCVDRDESPCLAALMTPPHRLLVSTGDAAAIPSLVECVVGAGISVSGAQLLVEMAQAFVVEWQRVTHAEVTSGVEMTLYATREVNVPDGACGRLRVAAGADAEWVAEAYVDFTNEVRLSEVERSTARDTAADMLGRGMVYLWEAGGAPVSMVCFRHVTDDGARIAPVYTLEEERGKGYATACVGQLTRQLLRGGVNWCSLFADVDNPASNRIYQRLGFEEACRYRVFDFGSAANRGSENDQ